MMLDIDREWGREPGWSLSQSAGTQATLIGYRRTRGPRPRAAGPHAGPPAPGRPRG